VTIVFAVIVLTWHFQPLQVETRVKLGKKLMSIDELAVMDGGKCILQLRSVRLFLSKKFDITMHPNYKYLSDADPRNAFSIEQFLSRRLVVKLDDQFEVFEIDGMEAEVLEAG
jgi:type IV secretion system protein VirD4